MIASDSAKVQFSEVLQYLLLKTLQIRVLHIRLGVYMWYLGLYLYHIGYMTHIKDYALHLRQLTQLLVSYISVLQTSVKGGSPRPVLWTVINLGLREYVL